jgi:hypothetical protein
MNEEPHKGRNSSVTWIAILCMALMAYILSPGLVVVGISRWGWKANSGFVKTYEIVYYPLAFLGRNFEPAGKFYDWYFNWCAGK